MLIIEIAKKEKKIHNSVQRYLTTLGVFFFFFFNLVIGKG